VDVLRRLAPLVLGALARRHGQFDACEDAVQEALLAAATSWPDQGRPDNPFTWLHTVAARRLIDHLRADRARREREDRVSAASPASEMLAPPPDEARADSDDSLTLLFLCCHPALTPPTQIALTLRAVGGLTTAEIAAAFLVPEATMAQRISRAKSRVKAAGARFTPPPPDERAENLRSVLQVLYLIFNEGYTSSAGEGLQRVDLTGEAIRLARLLVALIPDDGEALGLLALMLLTDARRDTRVDAGGDLIPLTDQDRARWDADRIAEGVALLSDALSRSPLGVYQLQAAIVAVHDEAPAAAETDWPQVLALYDTLERFEPGPIVTLNRAVALAEVHGPRAGLALLATLDDDERLASGHRLPAVRAHLLETAGEPAAAYAAYHLAARRALSRPEHRYLTRRAQRLADGNPPAS